MKKLLLFVSCFLLLTGCDLGMKMTNTPTKQVEIFLTKYQTLDQDVLDDLNYVVAEEELFNSEQRDAYKKLMKRHFEHLIYEIKEETIDGDHAVVTTEITVFDYSKVLAESEAYRNQHEEEFLDKDGLFNQTKYTDYRLERLKNVKDTVQYTIDFTLSKKEKDWVLDPISTIDQQKLNGTYQY